MSRRFLLVLILVCPAAARAQFSSSGDQTVTGQAGIGTAIPRARLDVVASSADNYGLWVASQNGTALLVVDKTGKLGIGTSSPAALVDVRGRGDAGDIGLQLRSGNSSSTYSSSQILFAYDSSGTYRHALVTRAAAGQSLGNEIGFFLWNSTAQPAAIGDRQVLSLQAAPSASSASVHVQPVGTPLYELVVSNGQTTGGGTVRAASVGAHSSRDLKTVLSALSAADQDQAYADVKSLKPARFRYKGRTQASAPVRGLIYEDAPASIRDERGEAIILEARLANMEMALAAASRRIKGLEKKIGILEGGGQ